MIFLMNFFDDVELNFKSSLSTVVNVNFKDP
jgi:hypothetical protein